MTEFVLFILTPTYQLIRQAVINRNQIVCAYKGYERMVCPHAIGTTNGVPRVLVYQFAGSSESGLPPDGQWRCMDIPGMTQIRVQPGAWHTGNRHTRQQTCIKVVDLDITQT